MGGCDTGWKHIDASDLTADTRYVADVAIIGSGAINSPALLLRSNIPDPHGVPGKQTFLHPTVIFSGLFDHETAGYAGAPQSIYSDHFLHNAAVDGPFGFKFEVPPLQPVLFSTTLQGFGESHARLMQHFAKSQTLLALGHDGFHPQSKGANPQLSIYGLTARNASMLAAALTGKAKAATL